ncbi:MAG: hypothetical protein OSA99_12225 [Acidimicrobiales bacterium]|nr:hypothetical protein [Acidimicrobiales bacterium]
MVFAATPQDASYQIVLLLHIVSFLVAFAPAVINPLLEAHFAKNADDATMQNWAKFSTMYTSRIALGSLGILLITGIIMIVQFDGWEFSQTWISLAFLVWLGIGGVVSAMILKGEKAIAAGDMSGRDLLAKGGPIATVLLLIMLYLMIFKPGL